MRQSLQDAFNIAKKVLIIIPAGLVLLILLYVGIAFGLLAFPVNHQIEDHLDARTTRNLQIEAYVASNGVHTDFIFPVQSTQIDWKNIFPLRNLANPNSPADFIAIGWGDREFYLNTPQWKDLTASRAFHALLGLDPSLIHVEYMSRAQMTGMVQRYRLTLSSAQYTTLVNYVLGSTTLLQGAAQPVVGFYYDVDDAFFEAQGHYSVFNTCNTWIGSGLRQAGIPISRWTPFDKTVYWFLQPLS